MGEACERLCAAINRHDLDEFVSLFASDYRSEQRAHPARAFEGADKVRENWTSVFAGIPDLRAELVAVATADEGVEIGEWDWQSTHVDGSRFAMRGVTVMGVEAGRIASCAGGSGMTSPGTPPPSKRNISATCSGLTMSASPISRRVGARRPRSLSREMVSPARSSALTFSTRRGQADGSGAARR